MHAGYLARPTAIKRCIDKTSERVRELRTQRERASGEDPAITKALRQEQTKVSGVNRAEGKWVWFSVLSCG